MAKLTSKARNALPASDFALPGRRFPVEDRAHAANAKARAAHLPPGEKAKVDAKANKVLGHDHKFGERHGVHQHAKKGG